MAATQLLGPDSYRGFLADVGDGADALTHKALVTFHGVTAPVQAYVKIYCTVAAPRGLVNELIGYALAKATGVDVPNRSAILLMNSEQAKFLPTSITPQRDVDNHVVAWCVEEAPGLSPKQIYNANNAMQGPLRDEIQKWPTLISTVVLDDWIVNDDRNMGNLIRTAPRRFTLIDHGRVCTGNSWARPLKRDTAENVNKLAGIAWGSPLVENSPRDKHAEIFETSLKSANILSTAEIDLDYWLPKLLELEDADDVKGFLEDRATTLSAHYKSCFGILA
ncbi:hypothetical protein ACWJLF_15705 [Xanthomonas axonopodis pv. maculifoliigardeniae]